VPVPQNIGPTGGIEACCIHGFRKHISHLTGPCCRLATVALP
jgi:putative component of membrane protein insertase Oxa1/YidC/SpoIIIJ protein YidD